MGGMEGLYNFPHPSYLHIWGLGSAQEGPLPSSLSVILDTGAVRVLVECLHAKDALSLTPCDLQVVLRN